MHRNVENSVKPCYYGNLPLVLFMLVLCIMRSNMEVQVYDDGDDMY